MSEGEFMRHLVGLVDGLVKVVTRIADRQEIPPYGCVSKLTGDGTATFIVARHITHWVVNEQKNETQVYAGDVLVSTFLGDPKHITKQLAEAVLGTPLRSP